MTAARQPLVQSISCGARGLIHLVEVLSLPMRTVPQTAQSGVHEAQQMGRALLSGGAGVCRWCLNAAR